jgi:NAD(P)-dependent dehydrogenase (short-subunit alcohol dehydrogenase family)
MTQWPSFSVAGKTVLISGGTGGIGGAFAKAFLDHGAKVIVADVKPPETRHPEIRYEQLDVRDGEVVDALARRIETLDVVIHCAGRLSRWEEYDPEVFMDIINIHLVGNLRLANGFRSHLKVSKGCVINIGSMYSYFGAPQIPAYAAAKTAVVSLTKSLAISIAEDGIRVNAIAPGWIKTEISRHGRGGPISLSAVRPVWRVISAWDSRLLSRNSERTRRSLYSRPPDWLVLRSASLARMRSGVLTLPSAQLCACGMRGH